jgi:hypothetical protein
MTRIALAFLASLLLVAPAAAQRVPLGPGTVHCSGSVHVLSLVVERVPEGSGVRMRYVANIRNNIDNFRSFTLWFEYERAPDRLRGQRFTLQPRETRAILLGSEFRPAGDWQNALTQILMSQYTFFSC